MSGDYMVVEDKPVPYFEFCPDGSMNVYRRDGTLAVSLTEDAWIRLIERLAAEAAGDERT